MAESDVSAVFTGEARFFEKMDELLSPLLCDVHQATQACSDAMSNSFRATKSLTQMQNYHQNSISHVTEKVEQMAKVVAENSRKIYQFIALFNQNREPRVVAKNSEETSGRKKVSKRKRAESESANSPAKALVLPGSSSVPITGVLDDLDSDTDPEDETMNPTGEIPPYPMPDF